MKFARYTMVSDIETTILKLSEISPHSSLKELGCTCCLGEIGTVRPIGIAWVRSNESTYPARLCNACLQEANKEFDLTSDESRVK